MKLAFIISFIIQLLLVNAVSVNRSQDKTTDSDYLITVPKVLANEQDKVCLVWLNEETRPASEKLIVKVKEIGSETVIEQISAQLTSETACVDIPTKKIRSQRAEIEISLGQKVSEKHEVQVRPIVNLVLIETSKPVYKPAETIKFNVFTVDQQLKPATEQFKKIWIENAFGTSIKQWRNVESKDGVLSFKLETAEENVLGKWSIKALTENNHLIVKVFELTRYLTPKINIDVTKPSYLLASDKQTDVEIRVNDQFNYPINGQVKVTVGYKPTIYEQSKEIMAENMPSEKFDKQVKDGKVIITIDHEKLQASSKHNAQRLLLLNIEVEQEKTNLTQTLIQELPISPKDILITLPSSRMGKQYFKPNLPFKSFFVLERPDLTEASGQKVTVCVEQRQKSWIQEKENRVCKQETSDKNGIVRFETKPIKENTEQLWITVQPTDKHQKSEDEEQKSSFVVQPWYDDSEINFFITPTIRRQQCTKKHNVEITFHNLNKKIDAFYQVVGRKNEAPKKFVVDPARVQKIDSKLSKMNLEIESEMLSSISQPVARVVVFMRDSNKTLVADYDTFEVDCQDKQAEIRVNAQSQTGKHQYEFNVDVNAQSDSRCILQVSQQEARHELIQKRVARLMEKMDFNLDLMNRDKCERDLYIRHARNTGLTHIVPQESIINFKSSWDVFNKVGLVAISNMDLDKAPCESELYPEGFSKEMAEEFEKVKYNLLVQRNYYINELSELNKLEANTTDDLVQWMDLEKNNKNQKVIVRNDQISEQGELHFNVICLSPKTGIQYGYKKVIKNTIQPFEVDIIAPEQMIVDEIVHVKVNLHKEDQHSVPVIVEPVPNSNFEITLQSGQSNKFNFEGEHHQVIYRVRALHPVSHTTLQFTIQDGQNGQQYPTKVHTHHMSIVGQGSIVRNTEYQILINDQNGNKQIELINAGNGKSEKQQVFNLTVSTDILEILIPKEKQQHQQKQRITARDGLSLQYKSPVELVSYLTILAETEKTSVQDEQQRKALRNEMERVYQILETKRLPDGSYSTFIGKSAALPFADLALTSTIFKLYVQLKHSQQLPQIEHAALKQTFYFLSKLQSEQGDFATPIQQSKAFPMSLQKSLDVTAYITMQLAEAKSDYDSPIMKKALSYIVQQLKNNSTVADKKEEQELANSVVAYLYALKGNNEKAEKWLAKVESKDLKQLAKREHGEQIIAIQTLTAIKMNKKSEIERLAKWLFNKQQEVNQDQMFSSPIMSQAIVRAWNAMNGQSQTVKVNGKQVDRNQVRLGDNVHKVQVEGKGFVIAAYKKEQTRQTENQKEFKITVNGLKRGFRSCAQRSINVCYKSKDEQKEKRNPVINIQIPTGFQVDEFLLASMLTYGSASQLDSFDIRQQNLHLLLKPAQSSKSHCIEIPIVQVQRVEQRQKNSIQMINYYDYQQQLSRKDIAQFDTIFYELPKECEIIDRPLFTLGQSARPQPINFRQSEQNIYEQHHAPLEILPCPEDVEDSCPVCLDELNKSHEKQVCETKFVSSVHRRDLKTHEREVFEKRGEKQQKTGKRCVVLPIKLEQIALNKEQKLQTNDDVLVYVNEKCRCAYINERQGHGKAILVKNNVEKQLQTKQAIQLTKEDLWPFTHKLNQMNCLHV